MASSVLASLMIKLGLNARDVETGAKKVDGIIGRLGGTSAAAGATIGASFGAVSAGVLRVGTDYKDATDAIRVGTGATGDALKDLEAQFRAVGGRVPEDMGKVSAVIADLNTRTGQTGEGLGQLAEQIIDVSRLTSGDAVSNVADLTRMFGDWSIATEDQSTALDKLFRASQASGAGFDELARQVVQFGAPLRNIGFEFEDAIALLAKWEKEGVNTTLSLGGLKIALGEFAKEGKDAKRGLEELVDQIVNAETATEAMALGVDKFGSRAGPDMVAAIREGRFAIDDMVDAITNGEDTIAGLADETRDAGDAFSEFKNQVKLAIGPIVKDIGGISDALGSAIFLLPALGGVLGRTIGKALGQANVARFMAPLGRHWGSLLGIGMAAAAIPILLGELGKVTDALKPQQEKVDALTASVGEGSLSLEEMQAELANTLNAITKLRVADTSKAWWDELGGLVGGILGINGPDADAEIRRLKAYADQLDAEIRKVQDGLRDASADTTARSALESQLDGIEAAYAEAVATIEDMGIEEGLTPDPAKVTAGMNKWRDAVIAGFGSVKQALQNPPQLISREDRIENMERRMSKVMRNINKAVDKDDPVNAAYWTRAAVKQQHQLDKMRGKSKTSAKDIQRKFRAMGVDIDATWIKTKRKAKQAGDGMTTNAKTAAEEIASVFTSMDLTESGATLMNGLASGMLSAMPAVQAASEAIASVIAMFFETHSPPKYGPLSRMDKWGPGLVDVWAGSMERHGVGRARRAGDAVAGAFSPAAAASVGAVGGAMPGGGGVTINGNIYGGPAGLRELQGQLERATRPASRQRRLNNLAEG